MATLTVIEPFISTQPSPASQTQPPGATVNYSIVASGTSLTYQWKRNGLNLSDDGIVSGATTANLALTGIISTNAGTYTVAVMNSLGSNAVTSSSVVLTVIDPAITTQPVSQTKNYGDAAIFTVVAAGTTPFTYQWLTNGVDVLDGGNISGANTDSLTVAGVSYLDAGSYSVVVSNGVGNSITSSVAKLTVRDPAITAQPASRTNCQGTTATFDVTAIGTAPVTYQWKRSGTNILDGGNISGATSSSLSLSSLLPLMRPATQLS